MGFVNLILCPAAVVFAIMSLVRKRWLWMILSYICSSLPPVLSLFDINKRIATSDISGIMDIYPTTANIYLIVFGFVMLMNVLATVRKK